MQFIYHEDAKANTLSIQGERFKYLIKVRRKKLGENLHVRNLTDDMLYTYKIEQIQRNELVASLLESEIKPVSPSNLVLSWAVIEPKIVEKTLPFLNEIGVCKINFVYTDFSQKNFKLDLERMKRIVINSSQQCGRSKLMEFEIYNNIKDYLVDYPQSYFLDFGGKNVKNLSQNDTVLIGCEGGFSQKERELFSKDKIVGFDTSLILRSESAICSLGAKILL